MSSSHSHKRSFNSQEFLGNALGFTKYSRLALILFVIGLLCGLAYYIFSTAAYYSRSTVRVDVFNYAVDSESADASAVPVSRAKRSLVNQLKSAQMLKRVAVRMGIADEGTSAASIMETAITDFKVGMEDNDHLVVEVEAVEPRVVREFAENLVEEYHSFHSTMRQEYREKAVDRYLSELQGIKEKLASRLSAKNKFEEENELVSVFVAQKQLSQVPVEIVWVKHRLTQMVELAKSLKSNELEPLTKLSLMNSFNSDMPDEVGRIIRSEKEGVSPIKVKETDTSIIRPERTTKPEVWRNLEKERLLVLDQLNDAREKGFLSESAKVVELSTKLNELEGKLSLELDQALSQFDNERDKLEARAKVLEAQLPEYHEVTRKYDQFRLDYEMIAKGELAWDQAHEEISERIAALEFGADKDRVELLFTGHTNLRDEIPVKPNKLKLLFMAVLLGLALAGGVPMGLALFDNTTSRLQALEELTGLIGLGIVPKCKREDLENIVRSPTLGATIPNQLLENFRIIRSNICLHPGRRSQSQVVMVTSARPSEGKTTQAANIAWAFNSIGERTLLIDNDLRRGRIHQVTGLDNTVGITNLLIGKAGPDEVIQQTALPLLDVVTRGPVVAGSTEVLSQTFYDDLIAHWRTKYDRIVIDTPPVLGLSETGALQRVADGVVLVVKAESTAQRDVTDAVELLKKAGAHLFGFVLNGIDLSKSVNYYNYQYYASDYYAEFDEVMTMEPDEVAHGQIPRTPQPQLPQEPQPQTEPASEELPSFPEQLVDEQRPAPRRRPRPDPAGTGNRRVTETERR